MDKISLPKLLAGGVAGAAIFGIGYLTAKFIAGKSKVSHEALSAV
jgi:hypothetical protein